ncbi:unnamed protein product [Tilletia caries]|uniref:Uncharacterized protein n=1 Tax=Tilletia caries TaxID=13290 RepID=A0ABN7J0C6_9BASI|nr:unnamed protein product [Tilletia caries]CAD6943807.1 unnamed protein product [Tilletia caries]
MATRDFSTFPNPGKMCFTDSDAKRECPQYGKNFITRDENENPLLKEAMHEIEKGVRFHCNLMLQVPEEDEDFKGDDFRNFMWWRQNLISTLIKAATAIELDHPDSRACMGSAPLQDSQVDREALEIRQVFKDESREQSWPQEQRRQQLSSGVISGLQQ